MKSKILALAALLFTGSLAPASWTTLSIGKVDNFNGISAGHLSDGRLLYAHNGAVYSQNAFGGSAMSSFSNAPAGDLAFLVVRNDSSAFVGTGIWGSPGPVNGFDPSNSASSFTLNHSLTQNHSAVNYGSTGLLIGGLNGTDDSHEIRYVTDNGLTNHLLIDNVSMFSGAFARSASGDLYVSDNDNLNVYRFTAAQIDTAIANTTTLTLASATFVHQFPVSGSLAVDSEGRLWASGWQSAGIHGFDPSTNQSINIIPGANDSNYQVMTFGDGVDNYIGWIHRTGWGSGDAITYGYALTSAVAVPEPVHFGIALAMVVFAGVAILRRRQRS